MSLERALALQAESWELQAHGDLERALMAAREALQLVEAVEGSASADAANLLNDLAELECDRQRFTAALALAERARGIEDALGGSWTGEDAMRVRIRTLSIAGALRRTLDEHASAETDLTAALRLAVATFGDDSSEAAEARNNLGVLCKYCGRIDEGLQLYNAALRAIVARHGDRSLEAGAVLHNIGGILHAARRFADAEIPARAAWEISRDLLGVDDVRTLRDAAAYAAVLDGLERYGESEPIHRRALAGFERALGHDHEDVASVLHNLGEVRAALGDFAGAESGFRRALAIKERLFGPESRTAGVTRQGLARVGSGHTNPARVR